MDLKSGGVCACLGENDNFFPFRAYLERNLITAHAEDVRSYAQQRCTIKVKVSW